MQWGCINHTSGKDIKLLASHNILSTNTMTTSISTRSLIRASRAFAHSNGVRQALRNVRRRGFADVAADDMTLPLKGYKVLDMTRVLAGVRINDDLMS